MLPTLVNKMLVVRLFCFKFSPMKICKSFGETLKGDKEGAALYRHTSGNEGLSVKNEQKEGHVRKDRKNSGI